MNIPAIVSICSASLTAASSLYTGEYTIALWAGLAAACVGVYLHKRRTSNSHRWE